MSPGYKHVAPLGLKASFSRFPFLSPSPLPPFRFNTCRPSGALVYLFVPPVYKHIAPLGLNPSRFPALNPENPLILRILIQTNGTCRPSGAKSVVFPFSRFLVLSPSPLPRSLASPLPPFRFICVLR